ncbi:MAG: hypothetical protein WCD17_09920 [Acinetobacter calcoaceticus]
MKKILKILKWLIVLFLMFVLLLGVIEFIANKFFDNAAKKDACADSGGAWVHQKDTCQFGPTDSGSKK